MKRALKLTGFFGIVLTAELIAGTTQADTSLKLKVDNQSSQFVTVVVSKSSDGSSREQRVVQAGATALFTYKSTCSADKTRKRDYLVYKGRYPSPGGNTIIGSGTFWMTAKTHSGNCSKTFEFKENNNNSGASINISPTVDGTRGGTLHISGR